MPIKIPNKLPATKILREENLQQMVTSSDFSKLSNANMLDKLIKLRVQVRKDYQMYLHKYELKRVFNKSAIPIIHSMKEPSDFINQYVIDHIKKLK